jgi:DNA-binding response OmpR family regulator
MEGKTILIADDDSDYLFQVCFYLKQKGFRVIAAESEKEASGIFEKERPDLAIFDLMMEHEDSGFILAHKFKRKYPDVPVILTTAVSAETGINFGMHSEEDKHWIKADIYLEKGMHHDKFIMEIEKLLKVK